MVPYSSYESNCVGNYLGPCSTPRLEVNPADCDGKVQLNARDRGGNVAENLLEDRGAGTVIAREVNPPDLGSMRMTSYLEGQGDLV